MSSYRMSVPAFGLAAALAVASSPALAQTPAPPAASRAAEEAVDRPADHARGQLRAVAGPRHRRPQAAGGSDRGVLLRVGRVGLGRPDRVGRVERVRAVRGRGQRGPADLLGRTHVSLRRPLPGPAAPEAQPQGAGQRQHDRHHPAGRARRRLRLAAAVMGRSRSSSRMPRLAFAMTPLWIPSPERAAATHLASFRRAASAAAGRPLDDYWALHAWSIAEPDAFWQTLLRTSGVPHAGRAAAAHDGAPMPATRWFDGVTLNYADALLAGRGAADDAPAIIATTETAEDRVISRGDPAPVGGARGRGARPGRHRPRRHGGGLRRQRPRSRHPASRLRRPRRDLLVLLARFRRRRRLRPLPPDRADAAAGLVVVSLQRQALRHRPGAGGSHGAAARPATPRRPRRRRRRPRGRRLGRLAGARQNRR